MMNEKNEMIFGIRALIEAIDAGKDIEKILIKRDLGGDLAKELFAALKYVDAPVQRVLIFLLSHIKR